VLAGENQPMTEREAAWYGNHDAALGPILNISKVFRRGKQNLYIYLLLVDLILKAFNKKKSFSDRVPLKHHFSMNLLKFVISFLGTV
jgi:hypothetical protein